MPKKFKSRKDGSHYPISQGHRSTGTYQTKTAHLSVPKRVSAPTTKKPKSFKKKTTKTTEVLGVPVKKETEETHISHVPSEITEEKEKSLNVDTKQGISEIDGSSVTNEKTTSKYPEEEKKTNHRKKPFA